MNVLSLYNSRDKFTKINPSGWRDTLNVSLQSGSITKVTGGNVHNTGGGFYDLDKPDKAFRIQFTAPQNGAFLFIGIVPENLTVIDFNQLLYGFYLRGSGTTFQAYEFGEVAYQETITDFSGKTIDLVRDKNGNLHVSINTDIKHWYSNEDTSLVVDFSRVSVMASIYTEGAGFNKIKIRN